MEQERTILETAILLFRQIADALIGLAGPAEAWLRAAMEQLGVPPDLRTAVLVLGAVALGLAVLRALGGLLRIAVVLALLALVLNALGDRPAQGVEGHAALHHPVDLGGRPDGGDQGVDPRGRDGGGGDGRGGRRRRS